MKKGFGLTLIFLVFLLPITVLAFQNEPDGFRGIKWGANISRRPDMTHIEKNMYLRKNDKLTIGDASLRDIHYRAYKGRLGGVIIRYKDYNNHEKLKRVFFQLYGKGRQPNPFEEKYNWIGSDIWILIEYSEIANWPDKTKEGEGHIIYDYRPRHNERKRKEKEAAKKGAGDL